MKNILIIGLGLIGGSLAKAIKNKLQDVKITAVDSNLETIKIATAEKIIDNSLVLSIDANNNLSEFDFIIIATPLGFIVTGKDRKSVV